MYAVIQNGGKQYRVEQGDVLRLESMPVEVGSTIDIDKVLMVGEGEAVKIGAPFVEKSKVVAKVLSQGRGKKIQMVKFKRRKHHEKWQGHRQNYTEVEITEIKS